MEKMLITQTDEGEPPLRRARPWQGEVGAAAVEHLGMFVFAAALVVVLAAGAAAYGSQVAAKVCEAMSGIGISVGSCDAQTLPPVAEGPTDEDFQPPVCTVQTNSQQYSSKVKIAFVTFGEDSGFIVAQNSDGTVSVTVTNGGNLGVEVGAGAKVGGKDAEGATIGANVNLGAGLTFQVGDTWKFDSMDQWEAMENQLNQYLVEQQILTTEGGWAYFLFNDMTEAPKSPTVTTSTFGVESSVSAQGGFRLQDGVDAKGKPKWFNPNLGVYGSGKLSDQVTMTTNHVTNETAETYTFNTSGELGVDALVVNAGISGSYKDAYKVTRNSEGEITSIQFLRETSSGSGAELDLDSSSTNAGSNKGKISVGQKDKQRTVTTTELKVTDANRSIVDEWVTSNVVAAANGEPAYYPGNAFSPTTAVQGDPLATLLYQQAVSSVQVYDNVEDAWSFGGEFALGLKLGASFSGSESESTISDAYFLGAPDEDGTRGYIPDEICVL